MILILSDEFDSSTNKVIDWIDYKKNKFRRINSNTNINLSLVSLNSYDDNQFRLYIDDIALNSNEITAYWYRRGYLNNKINFITDCDIQNYKTIVNQYLSKENEHLKEAFYTFLESKNYIGKISDNKINKLKVLSLAKEIGMMIPDTIITNQKNDVINFSYKHSEIITKSIKDNIHLPVTEEGYFMQYTDFISKEDILEIPDTFFPSIFQELINKQFELRIFYLKNKFYPMAIFSQKNDKTKIDFRRYDKAKPNRAIPFQLPIEYEKKLQTLMDKLDLVSGSIDVLVSEKGEFYFLEVNPVGQFGQVSSPCNYYLEKKIAEHLCS